MITSFKIYENIEEYNRYDYVYVNTDESETTFDNKPVFHPFCQILFINDKDKDTRSWDYFVESCDSTKKRKTFFIYKYQIVRKLRDDEIIYYNSKKEMNNFNL